MVDERHPQQPYYQRVDGWVSRQDYKEAIKQRWESGQRSDLVEDVKNQLGIRPYDFCTNGDEDYDALCNAFDSGATPQQIVQEAIENYEETYKFNSFSRGRTYFDPYSANSFLRSTSVSRKFLEDYDWASTILDTYGSQYLDLVEDIIGSKVQDLQEANDLAFGFIRKVLLTPDYGERNFLVLNEQGQAEVQPLEIPIGPGKNQYSSYIAEQQQIQFYTQKGILFEKAFAMSVLLSRTRSVRENFGLSGYEGSSFFGNRRYRSDVISMMNDLIADQLFSDPIGFQTPANPTVPYKFDPSGDRRFSVLLDLHPIVKAVAKVYAALFIDTPGVPADYEQLVALRSSDEIGFGTAPVKQQIRFADPDVPGKKWEVVVSQSGSSLAAFGAQAVQYFVDRLGQNRSLMRTIESWKTPYNLTAVSMLTRSRIEEQLNDIEAWQNISDKTNLTTSLSSLRDDPNAFDYLDYLYLAANLSLYTANLSLESIVVHEELSEVSQRLNLAINTLLSSFQNPSLSPQQLLDICLAFIAEQMDILAIESVGAELGADNLTNYQRSLRFATTLLVVIDDSELTGDRFAASLDSLSDLFPNANSLELMTTYITELRSGFSQGRLDQDLAAFVSYNLGFKMMLDTLIAVNGSNDPEHKALFNRLFPFYQTDQSQPAAYQNVEQHIGLLMVMRDEVYLNPVFATVTGQAKLASYRDQLTLALMLSARSILVETVALDVQRDLLQSRYYLGQLKSMRELGRLLSPISEL